MVNLNLRYVVDLDANLNELYNLTGNEFYKLCLNVISGEVIDGIMTFGKETAEKLMQYNTVPLFIDGQITEFPVIGAQLCWEVEEDNSLYDELGITAEPMFAATTLLQRVIMVNYYGIRMYVSKDKQQFKKYIVRLLTELKAAVLQNAAAELLRAHDVLSIRGRHMTLQTKYRNFVLPENLFNEYIQRTNVWKNIIVVENDTAYFVNGRSVKKLLNKLGIKVYRFQRVEPEQLKQMVLSFDKRKDTIIGHVFRHPIIGHVGVGTMELNDKINGIGVPADVAGLLDGDDDGDLIDAVVNIMVKNKKFSFCNSVLYV